MQLRLFAAAAAFCFCAVQAAGAAEITLIAPGGIRTALQDLIAQFERQTGNKVVATFGSGGATKDRVIHGEPFDVPVVQAPFEPVIASGHVVAASAAPLAAIAVGLAVKSGADKPDIATAEAVKRLLLGASSIAYPDPARGAAAGVSFDATLRRLGIDAALQPKLKRAPGGAAAMAMVAKGEAQLGSTFVSEMIAEPGIAVVGPLPPDISPPTQLVAFLSTQAKAPDAAKALIAFLSAPAAAPVYKARGMTPAN